MPTLPVRYPLSLVLGETSRARVVRGNADASDRRSGWSAAEIDEMEGEEGKGGGREEGGEERRAGLKTDTLGVCPRDRHLP